jgi:hypothetical protein
MHFRVLLIYIYKEVRKPNLKEVKKPNRDRVG